MRNEVGMYIKEQLSEADKDKDKELNLDEFWPWYDSFIKHVEECEKEEQRQKGTLRPQAGAPECYS